MSSDQETRFVLSFDSRDMTARGIAKVLRQVANAVTSEPGMIGFYQDVRTLPRGHFGQFANKTKSYLEANK